MGKNYLILIVPVAGLLLLLVGAYLLRGVRRFVKEAVRTTGTVVGFDARSGSKGQVYAPVVTFEVRDEGVIRFTDPMYASPKGYEVGQQVEVLYHWHDHSRARLASPFRLYFLPALLCLLGSVFTFVGAVIFLSK